MLLIICLKKKDEWKLKGNWVLVTRNKLMKIKQHITKVAFLLIISHSLNFALPTAVYTKSSSKCELDNLKFTQRYFGSNTFKESRNHSQAKLSCSIEAFQMVS